MPSVSVYTLARFVFLLNFANPNSVLIHKLLSASSFIASTENGGVSLFNFTTGLFTTYKADEIDKESMSNNSVYVIYRDTKNNMWLGNFAGGVDMVNRDKLMFNHYKHMMQIYLLCPPLGPTNALNILGFFAKVVPSKIFRL